MILVELIVLFDFFPSPVPSATSFTIVYHLLFTTIYYLLLFTSTYCNQMDYTLLLLLSLAPTVA